MGDILTFSNQGSTVLTETTARLSIDVERNLTFQWDITEGENPPPEDALIPEYTYYRHYGNDWTGNYYESGYYVLVVDHYEWVVDTVDDVVVYHIAAYYGIGESGAYDNFVEGEEITADGTFTIDIETPDAVENYYYVFTTTSSHERGNPYSDALPIGTVSLITTLPATQVGSLAAVLNGLYTGMDPAQLYFHLGTGEMVFYGLGANTYMWVARYGLTPSTTYTYRAVARIARVYSYGEWVSFTTTAEPVVPPYIPPPNYTTDPSKFIFVPKRKLTV